MRPAVLLALTAGLVLAAAVLPAAESAAYSHLAASRAQPRAADVRSWRIEYRAGDGRTRAAYVLLPAWYGPQHNPPLPLVISPHGRGVGGRANARLWGRLPALDRLAVVNPDGQGRRLPLYSWGYSGQVSDLATMPAVVRRALPWLRIAPHRVYAIAGSMGGQEVLLLAARSPRLLDGAAVVDAPTDLALHYREFPSLPCSAACLRRWKEPIGLGLQRLARTEVGGSPDQVPDAYAARSPLDHVAEIAASGVPLGLWWSIRDGLVRDPGREEAAFLRALERRHPRAGLHHVVGDWSHAAGFRLNLPGVLAWLQLAGPSR